MTANANAKLKLLHIMRMLQEETDEEHGLSMRRIIDKLSEIGIDAERKSVYRDIQLLREFGFDIRTYQRNPVEYAIARRDFSLSELMLMVDAVQSSRFITQRQSNALVRNIKLLASDAEREKLDKQIHVAGRIKSKNESVFGNVDVAHEAIRRRKKLRFTYWKTGVDGKPVVQHGGRPYVLTPVKVVYADGFYYLTTWSDSHESLADYRIDRMRNVMVLEEAAARVPEVSEHAAAETDGQYFGRFNGDVVRTTLRVAPDKVDIVLDRFGGDVVISQGPDGCAYASTTVRKSEQFFGWIAGLGATVTIEKPCVLKEEYRSYLLKLLEEV